MINPPQVLPEEPTAVTPHGGFWCSEASCHSSGCKSRQQKEVQSML